MSLLSRMHAVTVLRSTVLIPALVTTVAIGAERVRPASTPPRTLAPATFKISGNLALPLYPGASHPLDLRLTNRHRWDLRIVKISVAVTVDARHERAGCSREVHFRQVSMPARTYPLRLRAKRTRTLRQLGVKQLPRITMLDLPFNQRACRGATFKLRYVGRAARWGKPFARPAARPSAPAGPAARG